ncbi:MAG: hypothetical protein O7G87_12060 [bacterium]|nr:hypothetical protein [bacterium]
MNETAIDLSGASILVVDDVPSNLNVLCPMLEEVGYEALVASSGHMALDPSCFPHRQLSTCFDLPLVLSGDLR